MNQPYLSMMNQGVMPQMGGTPAGPMQGMGMQGQPSSEVVKRILLALGGLKGYQTDYKAIDEQTAEPKAYSAQASQAQTKTVAPAKAKRMGGVVKYWDDGEQSWVPAKTMQSKDGQTYWYHPGQKTFLPLGEE